ncbi:MULTISPECIES: hypothetical protein [unclassified Streptomyces]|uniref:hypothetical protein n=1 Tax=unclassified Streptomyces TaxID=2593676 RepID=UPI001660E683|nr:MULTISPECIES: hypothetical protein [unclassified Streptomyces]
MAVVGRNTVPVFSAVTVAGPARAVGTTVAKAHQSLLAGTVAAGGPGSLIWD